MVKSNYYYLSIILLSFLGFSSLKNYLNTSLASNQNNLQSPSNLLLAQKESEQTEQLSSLEIELNALIVQRKAKLSHKTLTNKEVKIQEIMTQVSAETNTPLELLEAICMVESNLDSHAFRRNDGGRGNHAIGLCQVLRKTGEMVLNVTDKGCKKDYRRIPKQNRQKSDCIFFDPYVNAKAAALYLQTQIAQHKSLEKVIAAYNAGSPRTFTKRSGAVDFVNREYVNKVLKRIQKSADLKGADSLKVKQTPLALSQNR